VTRFKKLSVTFPMSNEALRDANEVGVLMRQAMQEAFSTDPEVIARRKERQREADREARIQFAEASVTWATLAAKYVDQPALTAVLDLHRPTDHYDGPRCSGDDFEGYEAEEPGWPCRTIDAIREATP
jgi:hypothetical protein